MPIKVGIYVGKCPYPVFIERLVKALEKTELDIVVFGTIVTNQTNQKILGYKLHSLLNHSKIIFFIKNLFGLLLFNRADLKKYHSLKSNSTKINDLVRFYPILLNKPDILHVQWAAEVENFSWVQNFGIKLVLSLRGAHINYSPLANPKLALSYQNVFPQIDGFHGVSMAICEEATLYGADINKCHVVYSGFDLEDFPKTNWTNHFDTLKSRPLKIISVGRAHWKKGYHFALDAMHILKENNVAFVYKIIGAAGSEELLFQKDQLGLNDEVAFLDNVPFEEVKKKIREADVLLLPSVEEGIANVVLEAMLLGTLVLTTNCGGMVESLDNGDSGFVIPVRDSEAIAKALVEIKETEATELQKMIDAAYTKVTAQHDENKMVADMTALYKMVLN